MLRKKACSKRIVITGSGSCSDLGLSFFARDAREVGDKASYTGHHSIMKGKQPQVRFPSLTSSRMSCLTRVPRAVVRSSSKSFMESLPNQGAAQGLLKKKDVDGIAKQLRELLDSSEVQ